ncbi:SDR family NAD(P)-dependent oxidoreductase [Halovenus sp. WSH3]|uniref:SDR family NAD(P)-dependent oxidoreductase n=1 Tax=Halovenus carboxidivorans TaxID=2692199 RepID=A0A6B0T7E4_9EURY|nr:SDR family oxidoreductase [Halovenus carboxidivorans]MXR50810.1 SDR family NAD(P)-dependent oxidoreductase [Halovenus carboxidivorans]
MDGQTAVVTGASRGIGEAVAHAFAEAGAHVVICARDSDAIEAVAEEIEDAGGRATATRADVRDEFDVERLMETAAEIGGEIDCVVANAAVYHGETGSTPLTEESYAAFDDHMRTNARGTFATVRESFPHLAEDARVLVASGSVAREPYPGYGSYAVSKAAAEAIARGFGADTERVVGVVDPGQVATELSGERGHDPEDVAAQFIWAATEAPAELLDGEVVDRKQWRKETR